MSALPPFESYELEIYRSPNDAVADLLGRGYGVNQADELGAYLLPVACRRLHLPSVSLLLSSGADTEVRDSDSNTPLLCAIDVSHHNPIVAYEIVKALLGAGANIEARGYMDKTPFLKACSRGCLDILKLLVSSGCDIHAKAADVVSVSGRDLAAIFDTGAEFRDYLRSLYRV